jgi:DNA-binding transcriptional ArsR family regulator
VSHHTRVLAEAGLLFGEKRGRWTWWSVREDRLGEVRRALGG